MTHGPPQLAKLAEVFGAEPCAPPFVGYPGEEPEPAWRFWDFIIQSSERFRRFLFHSDQSEPLWMKAVDRHTITGVADEIRRRVVGVGPWRLIPAAEVVDGWVKNARVSLILNEPDHSPAALIGWWHKSLGLTVSRRDDPAGWPLALGALYHRQLEPLVDYALESPAYQQYHETLAAAWTASRTLTA